MKRLISTLFTIGLAICSSLAQNHEIRAFKTLHVGKMDQSKQHFARMYQVKREPLHRKRLILPEPAQQGSGNDVVIAASLHKVNSAQVLDTLANGQNIDLGYPYDNGIASSRDGYVVATTNQAVWIYNPQGVLQQSLDWNVFAGPGGTIDPQVVYDPTHDRFIVIILKTSSGASGGVWVVVSNSNDPTGAWTSYSIPMTATEPNTDIFADFPHLGISSDRLYILSNFFDSFGLAYTAIWDISLTDLYAGSFVPGFHRIGNDTEMRFVNYADDTYGSDYYGISPRDSTIVLYKFNGGNLETDTISTPSQFVNVNLGIVTPGQMISGAGDGNGLAAFYKDGTIYYGHIGVLSQATPKPVIIYGQITVDANLGNSTASTPIAFYDENRTFGFGTLSYAGYKGSNSKAAALYVVLTGTSSNYLGTVAYQIDPYQNVTGPMLLAEGDTIIGYRVGDYIQARYQPGSERKIWVTAQRATTEGGINLNPADDFYLQARLIQLQMDSIPQNAIPVLSQPITDTTFAADFGSAVYDLSPVFTDADADNLTYTASSSDTLAVTVNISGSQLTVTQITQTGMGSSTIRIIANDGNYGTAHDDFYVIVGQEPPNNPPVVAQAFPDTTLEVSFTEATFQLGETFSDADDDELTISAQLSTEGTVKVEIAQTTMLVSELGVGSTEVTLTADDGRGGTVEDVFTLTVAERQNNNAPVVVNPIQDTILTPGYSLVKLIIDTVFSDADEDILTYVAYSADTAVVTASYSNGSLNITEIGEGSTMVSLVADDGFQGTATDRFIVTSGNVTPNSAPTVAQSIADTTLVLGSGNVYINFANTFADSDGDDLSYSIFSTNPSVLTAQINDNDSIYLNLESTGSTVISLTANDGHAGFATDEFTVTVTNTTTVENNPPTVIESMADTTFTSGFSVSLIDISNVFSDQDGDPLTYTITSSDESVVTATYSAEGLSLTEVGIGSTNVNITVDDGNEGTASDEFVVTVNEEETILSIQDELIEVHDMYPNPATNTVSIRFNVAKAGHYTAELVDIQGKQSIILTGRRLKPGESLLNFNVNAFAPGVYILRISGEGPGSIAERKLVIER
ncbi:T9SS type A sorting domain-containing protein [Fulvivirgaceae bacterium BMA10]|uniref:T9SS type A sorting domain-containing protein n=1 Tax=Splendidivirga corallicola TaxID=3051826 RepID=A0ABT8KX59_9BACT|nr:T9SS type A sorting domain-containing protein [Fulvivirgaceae bacterium BMA10]